MGNSLNDGFRRRRWSTRDVTRRVLDSEDLNPDDVRVALRNGRSVIVMVITIVRFEVAMSEGFLMVIVGLVDVLRRGECWEHETRGKEETPRRSTQAQHEGCIMAQVRALP